MFEFLTILLVFKGNINKLGSEYSKVIVLNCYPSFYIELHVSKTYCFCF